MHLLRLNQETSSTTGNIFLKKTPSTTLLSSIALETCNTALRSVKPHQLLPRHISIHHEGRTLRISNHTSTSLFEKDLSGFNEVLLVGAGKATAEMASALSRLLKTSNKNLHLRGVINVPHGQHVPMDLAEMGIKVNYSSHPTPDSNGMKGAQEMMSLLGNTWGDTETLKKHTNTLVFVLVSGGGSALLPLPAGALSLEDIQITNNLLLHCGAKIDQINTVRKHIDGIKGGQLAKKLTSTGAFCISLILSDVVGDDIQFIASGPTAPDTTTFEDAVRVCKEGNIYEKLPVAVREHLEKGLAKVIPDTPKSCERFFQDQVVNIIIGSAKTSAGAAAEFLREKCCFDFVKVFSHEIEGEAFEYGKKLPLLVSSLVQSAPSTSQTLAFIGTGEFTVTIKGNGIGGRNQEMLLSFLIEWRKLRESNKDPLSSFEFAICSVAFDGIEGNSPAMGAFVHSRTLDLINQNKKLDQNKLQNDLLKFLENNDSNTFFNSIEHDIITGLTGTNVNDMLIILVKRTLRNKL